MASDEFIQHDTSCGRDVERPFLSQHWNADADLDVAREFRRDALAFVSEDEAHRPHWRPFVQVDRRGPGFDGDHVISSRCQRRQRRPRVSVMLPRDGQLRAERRLRNRALLPATLIGTRSDPAEHQTLDRAGIGGPEERTGVVQAANVVEYNDDGEPRASHAQPSVLRLVDDRLSVVGGIEWIDGKLVVERGP
jgi:hypothetical protein